MDFFFLTLSTFMSKDILFYENHVKIELEGNIHFMMPSSCVKIFFIVFALDRLLCKTITMQLSRDKNRKN